MSQNKQIEVTEQEVIEGYRSEQAKLEALKRAKQAVQESLAEILSTKETLKEIRNTKKSEKVLVSIGAGVFIETAIEKTAKAKHSIPGSIILEESIEKILERLEIMRTNNEKNLEAVNQEYAKTLSNAENLGRLIIGAQRMRQNKPQL